MKNILVLYGPTGSGKTSLSYEIIKRLINNKKINQKEFQHIINFLYKKHNKDFTFFVESNDSVDLFLRPINSMTTYSIINMDSKQIYSFLEELTASPNIGDKNQYNHWLFNNQWPWNSYTVHQWYQWVYDFIENTHYDLYLLVGGTNFYLKYFLTHQHCGAVIYNHYDDLVVFLLKNFSWECLIKMFTIDDRFVPNINDEFRKFNFLKHYFIKTHGSGQIDFNNIVDNEGSSVVKTSKLWNIQIIILNPSLHILKNHIKLRAESMNFDNLRKEYKFLKQWCLPMDKNFETLIGIHYLKNQDYNQFITENIQYINHQKKWIKYFLKNNCFNYSYIYINQDQN
jgi:tRNA A37 N6-isopentenylltransferase MiaA